MVSGTHGRKWITKQKDNIAFSFVIEANCEIQKLEGITIEIAETLIEVFKSLYNISLEIKSPNDIVYKDKKIGGILTETKLSGKTVKYIVVGIGIDTNNQELDIEIDQPTSSIKKEFNIKIDNKKIIAEFCNRWENKLIKRIGG